MSAQEAEVTFVCEKGNAEYQMRYDKLLAMFEERGKSPAYQEYIALEKIFDDKANFEGNRWDIIRKQEKGLHGVHEWVLNNIEKTDFNNCEEAEAEIDKLVKLRVKIFKENMVYLCITRKP